MLIMQSNLWELLARLYIFWRSHVLERTLFPQQVTKYTQTQTVCVPALRFSVGPHVSNLTLHY